MSEETTMVAEQDEAVEFFEEQPTGEPRKLVIKFKATTSQGFPASIETPIDYDIDEEGHEILPAPETFASWSHALEDLMLAAGWHVPDYGRKPTGASSNGHAVPRQTAGTDQGGDLKQTAGKAAQVNGIWMCDHHGPLAKGDYGYYCKNKVQFGGNAKGYCTAKAPRDY